MRWSISSKTNLLFLKNVYLLFLSSIKVINEKIIWTKNIKKYSEISLNSGSAKVDVKHILLWQGDKYYILIIFFLLNATNDQTKLSSSFKLYHQADLQIIIIDLRIYDRWRLKISGTCNKKISFWREIRNSSVNFIYPLCHTCKPT